MTTGIQNAIEFKVGPVAIRCTGDAEWVSHQACELLRNASALGAAFLAPSLPKKESVAELLGRAKSSKFGEKAGIIAYWLQEHGGRAKWRSGEIVKELERLGDRVPTNITDALNHKIRRGYFATNDRMWELTPAGKSWVLYDLLGETEDEEVNTYDAPDAVIPPLS